MPASSNDILGQTRMREVTCAFHSRRALDAAAQDLLLTGIDRSNIDVSASPEELQRRVTYASNFVADIADMPNTSRRSFVGDNDLHFASAVISSLLGCAVAVVTALYLMTNNKPVMSVALGSILIGILAGGISIVPVHRLLRPECAKGLQAFHKWEGFLIWVYVDSPEKESVVQEILTWQGGEALHVHSNSRSARKISPFIRCGLIPSSGTKASDVPSAALIRTAKYRRCEGDTERGS